MIKKKMKKNFLHSLKKPTQLKSDHDIVLRIISLRNMRKLL